MLGEFICGRVPVKRAFLCAAAIACAVVGLGYGAAPAEAAEQTSVEATLTVTSDWGSGYCANVVIGNDTPHPYREWEILFSKEPAYTSYWNAVRVDGVLRPAHWNGVVEPGQEVSVGYCAGGSDLPVVSATALTEGGNGDDGFFDDDGDDENSGNQGGVNVVWAITSDWGTGYCANVSIRNNHAAVLRDWHIGSVVPRLTSVWSAGYTSNNVFEPVSWTSTVRPEGSVSFGYCADGSVSVPAEVQFESSVYSGPLTVTLTSGGGGNGGSGDDTGNEDGNGSGDGGGDVGDPPNGDGLALHDSASIILPNEFRLGTGIDAFNWGAVQHYTVPNKQWAISLAHAAAMAHAQGLNPNYDLNAFFATAIKESNLGCELSRFPNDDGCFQIEDGTAFVEMTRMYTDIFGHLNHADIIRDSVITSALTKAYYDVFTVRMLDYFGYRAADFVADSNDPDSLTKIISIAYNRGLWFHSFNDIFNTHREACVRYNDMLNQNANPTCLTHEIAVDHAYAVSNLTNRLKNAPALGGSYYNEQVSWQDVSEYIDAIAPMQPGIDTTELKNSVKTVFDDINGGSSISYRYDLPEVIRAILVNTWEIPEPFIGGYY